MNRSGLGFQLRWLLLPASWVLLASGLSLHEQAYTGVVVRPDGVVESVDAASPGAMAGLAPKDVDVCQIYDCYTYTVIVSLEDYGFCAKGEGGPFVASGALGPGGSLPTNTGGGELSAYYMWGMTPISEGILQARGTAGRVRPWFPYRLPIGRL